MAPRLAARIACALATIVVLAMVAAGPSAAQQRTSRQAAPDPPQRIEITARPIEAFDPRDPGRRRFGSLEFRGGLELSSSSREFGGLSSLRIVADGERFIVVSDKGRWLRGRLIYREGRLAGVTDAEMAPILGPDGRAITARGWYDTESLAEDDGTLYVGLERVNRILRFDYGRNGLLSRGQPMTLPQEMARLPNNRGMECMVAVPKPLPGAGRLIVISERATDAAGNIRGFLLGGTQPGTFSVRRSEEFDVTDCAVGPSGDLFVLERRFSWVAGVAMRVRQIALSTVLPGATVDGKVLIFADMGQQIDNMEALAVHRTRAGDTVLTMMSDDNFSFIQRTLLLQFTLTGE